LRALRLSSSAGWLLLPWAVLVGFALRAGPYGLTEEGSKALLLAWSIADQVPSTAITLGAPDIRLVFFLPLAVVWSGQVIAAKWLTLLIMAAAGAMLYSWRARDGEGEAALLATGLLLIAPLTVNSIDSLSAAPFLLAICGAATWLNGKLSRERGTLGGWFFAQMVLCGAAVSLHPAGLAYPVALIWYWLAEPKERRDRQIALTGVPLIVALVLLMRVGWSGTVFGQNPLTAAAAVFSAGRPDVPLSVAAWLGGFALIALTGAVALHERKRLMGDLTGATLMLGVLFGVVAADKTWALLLFALLLYAGFPWLLRVCAPLKGRGLLLQRGWLWVLLVVICTVFMRTNRADFEVGRLSLLSAEDDLIRELAVGINGLKPTGTAGAAPGAAARASAAPGDAAPGDAAPASAAPVAGDGAPILVASPWPARTSIACRCGALPLPPAAKDPESQLAMMRGVTYVILADSLESRALANNFSRLGARVEVMSKQPGGVILRLQPPRDRL
jgi:hypothetical protein